MSSRIKKPSLDDMGPGTDRPVPARKAPSPQRSPQGEKESEGGSRIRSLSPRGEGWGEGVNQTRTSKVDPRTKAGAFGEKIRGPHKPTLDEMGPHASLPVKKWAGSLPQKPDLSSRPSDTPIRSKGSAEPGPRSDATQPPKPVRALEFDDPVQKKSRKGRRRKTGRPGA